MKRALYIQINEFLREVIRGTEFDSNKQVDIIIIYNL